MITPTLRGALAALAVVSLAACNGVPANPASPSATSDAPSPPRTIQVVIDPVLLPPGGGTALIRLEVLAMNGGGVRDAAVALSVSGGTLDTSRATTDASGHAKVQWTGTTTAMVTATLGEIRTDTLIAVDVPAAGPPPDAPPQSPPSPRPVPPFPEIPTPPAGSQLQVSLAAEPEQALEGQAITFRATPRGLNNENVTSYEWDFDGDGTIDETSADGTRAHVYPTHGVKSPKVTIRTTAQHLATGTCSVTIGTAPASLSVILASNPASAPAGSAIAFNAIVSINAAAGTVTHYTWDWDTAVVVPPTVTTTATASHAYPTAGPRTARVTVTSSTGLTATGTSSVDVTPAPTTATITLAATPQSTPLGQPIAFAATVATTGSPGAVLAYDWDWDTSETDTPTTTTSDPSAGHTYATTGTRVVRLTVTYASGLNASATISVSVTEPPAP